MGEGEDSQGLTSQLLIQLVNLGVNPISLLFWKKICPYLEGNISPQAMRKLWLMLAHYHGNILNYSELGRSLAITDKKIKSAN